MKAKRQPKRIKVWVNEYSNEHSTGVSVGRDTAHEARLAARELALEDLRYIASQFGLKTVGEPPFVVRIKDLRALLEERDALKSELSKARRERDDALAVLRHVRSVIPHGLPGSLYAGARGVIDAVLGKHEEVK